MNPTSSSTKFGDNGGRSATGGTSLTDKVGDALARGKSAIEDKSADARDDLKQELSDLRRDMAKMQETMARFASDAGSETLKAAKNVGGALIGEVGASAQQAVDAGSKMADAAGQQIKTVTMELEGMARRNPLGTIAGAVAVGVVLGMMKRH